MKVIICDVGNAACSIISSPNKYGMMIDCGSNTEKENPVDAFNRWKGFMDVQPFITSLGVKYPLGLLHITHPDSDHVRNAKRVREEITPYLLHKRESEEFPDADTINNDYKENIDKDYRTNTSEPINWGFDINKTFQIPMFILNTNESLSNKLRNNSSILRYVKYSGISILYTGDMEIEGWNWLIENNQDFVDTVKDGIDILIAPHHGHRSGFPTALFDVIGEVKCVIHSKGSEGAIDRTDVSTQYSSKASGVYYESLNDNERYIGKVLSTRSNGYIFLKIEEGNLFIWTSKASSNHEKVHIGRNIHNKA